MEDINSNVSTIRLLGKDSNSNITTSDIGEFHKKNLFIVDSIPQSLYGNFQNIKRKKAKERPPYRDKGLESLNRRTGTKFTYKKK